MKGRAEPQLQHRPHMESSNGGVVGLHAVLQDGGSSTTNLLQVGSPRSDQPMTAQCLSAHQPVVVTAPENPPTSLTLRLHLRQPTDTNGSSRIRHISNFHKQLDKGPIHVTVGARLRCRPTDEVLFCDPLEVLILAQTGWSIIQRKCSVRPPASGCGSSTSNQLHAGGISDHYVCSIRQLQNAGSCTAEIFASSWPTYSVVIA